MVTVNQAVEKVLAIFKDPEHAKKINDKPSGADTFAYVFANLTPEEKQAVLQATVTDVLDIVTIGDLIQINALHG